jgi:tRNA(Arg) A34 adenosine deaminase TadA
MQIKDHERFMQIAIGEAKASSKEGNKGFGSV